MGRRMTANAIAHVARLYESELDVTVIRENQIICIVRIDLAWRSNRRARDEERARAEVPRISLRNAS
jgi:hypothetical protein